MESEIVANGLVNNKINHSFIDGVFVEIVGGVPKKYEVEFFDKKTNNTVYSTILKNNTWSKPNVKFYVDWKIVVKDDGVIIDEHDLDLEGKKVLISFESFSLGFYLNRTYNFL